MEKTNEEVKDSVPPDSEETKENQDDLDALLQKVLKLKNAPEMAYLFLSMMPGLAEKVPSIMKALEGAIASKIGREYLNKEKPKDSAE